jgi:hypothetical protein
MESVYGSVVILSEDRMVAFTRLGDLGKIRALAE